MIKKGFKTSDHSHIHIQVNEEVTILVWKYILMFWGENESVCRECL